MRTGIVQTGWLWSVLVALNGASAAAMACDGRVLTVDGQGIAGQLVSNGRQVASTGADGRYALPGVGAQAQLFVIARDGWMTPDGDDGLPAFWRTGCGDLQLAPSPIAADAARGPERVLVFSDPQVGSDTEVDYYARGIVGPARGEEGVVLGVTLGDVSNDVPALYPGLNRATALLDVPWLHVAGNHDVDAGATDDAGALSAFRAVYGPDTFARETRHAVFVMLDNVISTPGQRPAYVGGLREDQFAFLERYLPVAPRDRLLVVAAHIPWFNTAAAAAAPTVRAQDRERLFGLLRDFPHVLLLTGHRHTQRQFFHDAGTGWHGGNRLHEYNVGAASGAFWSGVPDAEGIPHSTMADGTPKGYAVLDIGEGGGYTLAWRPATRAGDMASTGAMALHAPKVLRSGAYPPWALHANVFMGHEATRVEYRIAAGEWQAMSKVEAPDPRLLLENVRDDQADTLRARDRSAGAEPSAHLWRARLDTRQPPGEYTAEVRAFDDQGGEHRAQVVYRLERWND